MADEPSPETKNQTSEPPAPEVLKPQVEKAEQMPEVTAAAGVKNAKKTRRGTYRPSHKATFFGLTAIVIVLAINAAVITFVIKGQQKKAKTQSNQGEVTINPGVLDKLGVSRNAIGDSGLELLIGPNTKFSNKIQVGGDVNIAGQLKLNSKFSATDASLAKLDAGNTSLAQLNVNGNGTLSTLNLRNDLVVAGATRLQGPVTLSQLLTINNNVNVSGSLSVGGTLSANGFHASSLISDSTLTIGGHVITRGNAPGIGPGTALGSNGTVSISGNDASGTVGVNTGTGAGNGILAHIAFRSQYSNIPHVVITTVGAGVGSVYVIRSIGGFSIGVNGPMPPGGFAFDYIVQQ